MNEHKIEMLNQPLLTEDGFLNEACINEMEAAFRNMPETHERLKNNEEWNTPRWTFDTEIVGALANFAIRQFGSTPPNLGEVCRYLQACLRTSVFIDTDSILGVMKELSLCEINKQLWSILGNFSMFLDWNDSEKYSENFICLSALLHNVCLCIRDARRHNMAFDIKFEIEYKQCDEDVDKVKD